MGRYGAKLSNEEVTEWPELTSLGGGSLTAHVAASDPHTGYQKESEKGAANGYASLDAGTKLPIAQVPTGSTGSTVCLGNDSRLSDARTPLSHGHSIGDTTGLQTALDSKAASSHVHDQSDVTNLATDLAGKQPLDATLTALAGLNTTVGIVEQTGTDAFTKRALGVAASTSIPTRADADTRYAAAAHAHAQSEVTNLVSDLAGKAASVHSHAQSEVTNLVTDLAAKQATLVSGTNIKTINGVTVLGSGDLVVSAGAHSHAIGDIVPPSGGGTVNFLRADGAWAAPVAVAGDLSYSPGSFTVVTETQRIAPYRIKLTGSQRMTVEGTGRLSCHN